MTEAFDREAQKLVLGAKALEEELTDLSGWGRRIDEGYMLARLRRDRQAQDAAGAESRRLSDLCAKRGLLWQTLSEGLDQQDIEAVRTAAAAIRQSAEDAFRRMEGEWEER